MYPISVIAFAKGLFPHEGGWIVSGTINHLSLIVAETNSVDRQVEDVDARYWGGYSGRWLVGRSGLIIAT